MISTFVFLTSSRASHPFLMLTRTSRSRLIFQKDLTVDAFTLRFLIQADVGQKQGSCMDIHKALAVYAFTIGLLIQA